MRTQRFIIGNLTSLVICGSGLVAVAQAADAPPPQIPTCDKKIGTMAVTEPENNWWTAYQLDSPHRTHQGVRGAVQLLHAAGSR
ncbi:MAG: hypothetical protein WDM77_15690 [Steroidobacteraceae bacterium]